MINYHCQSLINACLQNRRFLLCHTSIFHTRCEHIFFPPQGTWVRPENTTINQARNLYSSQDNIYKSLPRSLCHWGARRTQTSPSNPLGMSLFNLGTRFIQLVELSSNLRAWLDEVCNLRLDELKILIEHSVLIYHKQRVHKVFEDLTKRKRNLGGV